VAIGRRNGMVQVLHIPLYIDHDTCSISISTHTRIRITSPYVKVAQLRLHGPAVHISAIASTTASAACVVASHASSGHFSLWQLLHDPRASFARCSLCPSPSPFPSEAIASFCYRRSDQSTCIITARASGVDIWLYPLASLEREAAAAAVPLGSCSGGVMVASLKSSPRSVTAMTALQFECEAVESALQPGEKAYSKRTAVKFIIGYDDGSLCELHADVWGQDVGGSVSCWSLPSARSCEDLGAVRLIQPWHHGSCLFACAWADGCVQVFGSQGQDGRAHPVSQVHKLAPGNCCTASCNPQLLLRPDLNFYFPVVCLFVCFFISHLHYLRFRLLSQQHVHQRRCHAIHHLHQLLGIC
jgi:hypothetical protein